MSRYNTILWDVDETLLDFKQSEEYALGHCFELYHLTITQEIRERYTKINNSYWKKIEKNKIDQKVALIERFTCLFEEIGVKAVDPVTFYTEYAEALGSVYFFKDDAYQIIQSLRGRYKQYLVTNGTSQTQRKKLMLSGLDKLVEDIFISEEINLAKPQKAFFDACFKKIPYFDAHTTMIVGDSLSSDILGGNNAGITTCWYNPLEIERYLDVTVDYEIKNLKEVITICHAH